MDAGHFLVDQGHLRPHDQSVKQLPFIKCHGLGNDFVLVDVIDQPTLAALAWNTIGPRLCDRRRGIGADGVLVLTRSPEADCAMRIVNADGSDAQMCGNGIRCVARHLAERRGFSGQRARIATGRGVLGVSWTGEGEGFAASVGMGVPELETTKIPVRVTGSRALGIDAPLPTALRTSGGVEGVMTCISMGNPHTVLFCSNAAEADLEFIGHALQSNPIFPQSVNVHLVQVIEPRLAIMRSYERGAGATPACGTGACAALVAGVLSQRLERKARLRLPGGDLDIAWDDTGVTMTGPATLSFTGEISLD